MTFHVYRNKTHVTVVNVDEVEVEGTVEVDGPEYSAALDKAAMELARSKFEDAGLETESLFLAGKIGGGDGGGDDPVQGLVGEAAFIEAASALASGDVSFDSDAVVSGYNLQGWVGIDPDEMYHHLAEEEPVPFDRHTPDREEDLHEMSAAAQDVNRLVDDSVFSVAPEVQGRLAALKEALGRLAQLSGPKKPDFQRVIQTWEVREGSADEFTAEQKQPWKLDVEMLATDQLCVDLKPARCAHACAPGLSVWLEVDEGIPTVHISANGQDNLVHIRGFGEELEITPAEANTFHFGEKSRREGVDYCIVARNA